MIKLTGNVSRKVPIPGTEYSSQSFSAGMEIEVGNDASLDVVQKKFKEMYAVLEDAIKAQLISNGICLSDNSNLNNSVHNQQHEEDPITPNQKRLIEKLVKEQQIFGQERIRFLGINSKEEAKKEIKNLLARGNPRR
jgi:hypothetical protein